MRRTIHIAAAAMMSALGFISCGKEAVDSQVAEYAELTVNINGGNELKPSQILNTRAALDPVGEAAVNNVQIFVFRTDGSLDAYLSSGQKNDNRIKCTTGRKTVIAVVNAPDLSSVISKQELLNTKSELTDNSSGNYVMTGEKEEDIIGDQSVTVSVKRIAARISIGSIEVDYDSDAYKSADVKLKAIYVVNAAGNSSYSLVEKPTKWFNSGKYISGPADALLYKDTGDTSLSEDSPYNVAEYFYVYPNRKAWSGEDGVYGPVTRLVVETSINGKTYYYPVRIPDVERNKKYSITKLTITRPGSESPDIEVVSNECLFSVTVDEWEKGSEETVVI